MHENMQLCTNKQTTFQLQLSLLLPTNEKISGKGQRDEWGKKSDGYEFQPANHSLGS